MLSLGFSARLMMRFGAKATLLPGLALITAGLALFARAPVDGSYVVDVLPAMLLLGVGAGLSFPALMTLAMSGATQSDSGLASGLVNTSLQVGGALGLAVLATLSATRTESLLADGESTASALTGGYHLAFIVAAGLVAVAGIVAVTVLQSQREAEAARRRGAAAYRRPSEAHDVRAAASIAARTSAAAARAEAGQAPGRPGGDPGLRVGAGRVVDDELEAVEPAAQLVDLARPARRARRGRAGRSGTVRPSARRARAGGGSASARRPSTGMRGCWTGRGSNSPPQYASSRSSPSSSRTARARASASSPKRSGSNSPVRVAAEAHPEHEPPAAEPVERDRLARELVRAPARQRRDQRADHRRARWPSPPRPA